MMGRLLSVLVRLLGRRQPDTVAALEAHGDALIRLARAVTTLGAVLHEAQEAQDGPRPPDMHPTRADMAEGSQRAPECLCGPSRAAGIMRWAAEAAP